ncbi:MAG: hypothetical protein AAF596_00015 [Planctomycetota bacterium]
MTTDATIATLPAAGAATPAADRWAGRLDATLERASDWLNPILVKETRQALKSRQFVLWFLLLLGACWIVTIGGVTLIGPSIYYASTGGMFYWAYFIVLAFPLMVVVPFSAYRSLAAEQEENTRDLLMVSALSPQQIVNGKIGSAVLQMMVYFSALAPCLAFTYLLRGVDLVSIVMPPVYVFAASLLLSMAGLTAASLTRRKYGQVILSIGFVVLLLSCFGWGLGAIALLMTEGFQYFRDSDFWIANLMVLNFVVTTFLLLYYAAAGLNTFTAANRSTPIRVVLFIKQACCVGWVSYAYIRSGYESELLFVGIALTGLLWFAAGGVMTGEAPVLSNRVRRTLPTTAVGRVFGSWFNPGPGTGLMFAVATWSATVGPVLIALLLASPQTPNTGALFLTLATAYAIIFLGVGRFVVSALRRVAEVTLLGCLLIHFLLVLGASAAPLLLAIWTDAPQPRGFVSYLIFSPMVTLNAVVTGRLNAGDELLLMLTVPGVALCVLLVCLVDAGRETRQTRTPIPKRVIEDEEQLNPTPAAAVKNPWGDL